MNPVDLPTALFLLISEEGDLEEQQAGEAGRSRPPDRACGTIDEKTKFRAGEGLFIGRKEYRRGLRKIQKSVKMVEYSPRK